MFPILDLLKNIINSVTAVIFLLAAFYFLINSQKEYAAAAAVLYLLLLIIKRMIRGKSVDKMTGKEFEEYCAKLIKKKGFHKVCVTPSSGDYGADVIAYDFWGRKWVFQCKRFKGKVTNKAVQEVVASKAHYNADKAAVITNSELTVKARELAKENDVVLYEKIKK